MRFAASALLAGLAAAALNAAPPSARSAEAASSASCLLSGRSFFDKDTQLNDAAGREIARFSGADSAVKLLSAPSDASGLSRIETGTGRGSFRLSGFVPASQLRVYTLQRIPVVPGHVFIDSGTRVTLAGASGTQLKVIKQVQTPFNQRFSATAECGALTLAPGVPPGFSPPGDARVYLMKQSMMDLYSGGPPDATIVTTLQKSPLADNVRFFSTEQRAGFVRVQYRAEIVIDGWAKASDLKALPRGETADVASAVATFNSPPQLKLEKAPRVVKTTAEVPLRLAAKPTEKPVGVIEPDTEVLVLEVIADWATVLPKSLHVLPPPEAQFWVKMSDLVGLSTPR
jgi:hypothetical protein